jgi:hypothetical protein
MKPKPVEKLTVVNGDGSKKVRRHLRRTKGRHPTGGMAPPTTAMPPGYRPPRPPFVKPQPDSPSGESSGYVTGGSAW